MSVREKTIENSIKRYLEQVGAYVVKHHGGAYSRVGVPDILVCYRGRYVAIEVKNAKGKTSPLQDANIEMIRKAGGYAIVARSLEEVKALLAEVDRSI